MALGTGRVFRRDKMFWLDYSVNGKRIRESAKTTDRKEALQLLKTRSVASAANGSVAPSRLTLAVLYARVLERYENKNQNVKDLPGHAKAWSAALGETARPGLWSPLEATGHISRVINVWRKAGVANATINRRLAYLRLGLRLLGATLPNFSDLILREDNVREYYLDPPGFDRFYTAAVNLCPELAQFLTWLYVTGIRKGEAAQIAWSWLDMRNGRWTCTVPPHATKNRKARTFHIAGPMRDIIELRLAMRLDGTELVFHRCGQPIASFDKLWEQIADAAAIPDVNPHDFRRAAVTNMLQAGMTPKEIMSITGHRTLSTFYRYAQLVEEHMVAKLEGLARPACLRPTPPACEGLAPQAPEAID